MKYPQPEREIVELVRTLQMDGFDRQRAVIGLCFWGDFRGRLNWSEFYW